MKENDSITAFKDEDIGKQETKEIQNYQESQKEQTPKDQDAEEEEEQERDRKSVV